MPPLRLLILLGLFCPFAGFASGMDIYDQNGCKFWDAHPRGAQRVTWTGECKDGYGEGPGSLSWFYNNKLYDRSEGTFVHGKAQGKLVRFFSNGVRSEVQVIDGEPIPTATRFIRYPSGEEDEVQPPSDDGTSHVKVTLDNGDSFEGEAVGESANKWQSGLYHFANGDQYEGSFTDRKRTGHGVLTWANGRRYEGDFVDGVATGHGIETLPDGSRYEGGFSDFAYLGHGVYKLADGSQWEGEFQDAKSMADHPSIYFKSSKGTMERTPEFRAWATTTANQIWGAVQKDNPQLWRKFASDLGYLEARIDDQGTVGPWRLTVSSSWPQFDEAYLHAAQGLPMVMPAPVSNQTLVLGFKWVPPAVQNFAIKNEDPAASGFLYTQYAVTNRHVPPGAKYAELTPAQKEVVKSPYQAMPEADEPPYPINGMGELDSNVHNAAGQIESSGHLRMVVDVDSTGQATAVNVIDSPGSRTTKVMAAILMLQKYKPAICSGVPCKMQFVFDMTFLQSGPSGGASFKLTR